MNGKGSDPRPCSVSQREYAANFERTFGPKTEAPDPEPKPTVALRFTGKATLVLELQGHGPMDLRFEDEDLVLDVLHLILDRIGNVSEVLAYEDSHQALLRSLLPG